MVLTGEGEQGQEEMVVTQGKGLPTPDDRKRGRGSGKLIGKKANEA